VIVRNHALQFANRHVGTARKVDVCAGHVVVILVVGWRMFCEF
jgi:hypothetical protein